MEPRPPRHSTATIRQQIAQALSEGYPLTSRDISQEVHASEKEIIAHLEHIRQSLRAHGSELHVIASECRSCGYAFKGRQRLTKPGRCPECSSTNISPPEFTIRAKGR